MSTSAESLPPGAVLIGVDGGASGVRAHAVELRAGRVRRSRVRESAEFARLEGPGRYVPVPFEHQEAERHDPHPGAEELAEANARLEVTAACIERVARAAGAESVLLGVAQPGLKTRDGRGVALLLNGPRCPDLAGRLEKELRARHVQLLAPIGRLTGDGEAGGHGEQLSEQGGLREVTSGYYLGGGTGLAEALVLAGRVLALDEVETWFPKAWRLPMRWVPTARVDSYERWLSARGLNELYRRRAGVAEPLGPGGFPEERLPGDEQAQDVFRLAGFLLAKLVLTRVLTLWNRSPEEERHPGPIGLERVVVGARLGRLFADQRTEPWLAATARAVLDEDLHTLGLSYVGGSVQSIPGELGRARLGIEGLLTTSKLECPAALGTAALAWESWRLRQGPGHG